MPLALKDRVRETSSTTGTGTLTLAGAVVGFQSFSVIGNANTTYYAIVDGISNTWEVGLGTYTASGTTLSRDTVLESSAGGGRVSFGAGEKDVFCTYPAEQAVTLDDVQTLTNKTLTGAVLNGTLGATTPSSVAATTVTATGNVGIGTATPRSALDLGPASLGRAISWHDSATLSLSNIWSGRSGASLTLGSGLKGSETVANGYESSVSTGWGKTAIQLSSAGIALFTNPTDTVPYGTPYGPAERMRITSAGNVGIGTVGPTERLSVVGNVAVTGGISATGNVNSGNGTGFVQSHINGNGYDLLLGASGGGIFGFVSGTISTVFNTKSVPLGVLTIAAQPLIFGTTSLERVRITPAGNVGVGTTTPTERLSVVGNVAVTGGISATGTVDLSNNAIRTDASGNTSIGAGALPNGRLTVFNNSSDLWASVGSGLALNGGSNSAVSTITTFYDATSIRIGAGVSQKTGILIAGQSATGGNLISARVGNAERLRITQEGNVGIGTVAPTERLSVVGNVAVTGGLIATGTVTGENLSGTNTGDNATNTQYSGLVTNATHTGDATGSDELTIANNAVNNVKLADMATATLKGRVTAATGDPEDLTTEQVRSLLSIDNVDNTSNATERAATATLTNKTLTGYTETVFALTGTTPDLDPANGTVQTWVLPGNSTPTSSIAAGQSMTLMIDDDAGFTITWPSVNWRTNAGTAPTLNTTGFTAIVLWNVGDVLYGARVGDA